MGVAVAAFEELKELQSCTVAGGKGRPGHRQRPGPCAEWAGRCATEWALLFPFHR